MPSCNYIVLKHELDQGLVPLLSDVYQKPPAFLFHYTNASSLKSMLHCGCIWATSAAQASDKQELSYGCNLLAAIIKDRMQSTLTQRFTRNILESLRQRTIERIDKTFLTCFCEEDDALSLWRAYGNVCLRFPITGGPRLNPRPGMLGRIVRATYSETKQRHVLECMVDTVIAVVQSGKAIQGDLTGPWAPLMANFDVVTLAEYFIDALVSFKARHFIDEREWRCVIRPQQRPFCSDTREADSRTKAWIKEADVRGNRKSYTELIAPVSSVSPGLTARPKLPIDRVRIGPFRMREAITSETRSALRAANSFADVIQSEIPTDI